MKDLKIFTNNIEQEAINQIDNLLEQPAFANCKVRIMPDVHAGAGCVIGFTANLGDKVIPNIVGVDIGCGMLVVPLGKTNIDYNRLDEVIRENVPYGHGVHEYPSYLEEYFYNYFCYDNFKNVDRLAKSSGTLGGGNHFIEVDEDDEGNKYLVIHSGSRNLGKQVAEIYQNIAIKKCCANKINRDEIISRLKQEGREKEIQNCLNNLDNKNIIPKEFCYLEGVDRFRYLHDMKMCQKFAEENRHRIARIILGNVFNDCSLLYDSWESIHNYIDNNNIVRKGAISAHRGEQVIIPMNMRDGCIIGVGKGNPDWNYSAPHGAGRVMSRMKARVTVDMQEFENSMKGIFTTSVNSMTIDEAPMVYKPMQEILNNIKDTIEVKKIIKPVYNFKADN